MTKYRKKALVIITAVTAAVLSATVMTVPVKAEIIPPAEDAFEKEMEYPKFFEQESKVAAEGYDDAVNGLKNGSMYLNSINQAAGAAQQARINEIMSAIQKETAYLNQVNPSLLPAVQSELEREMAWFSSIDDKTREAGRARDIQAENGASAGLSYLTR